MELKNLMEVVVSQAIDDIKRHYEFCNCEQCRLDIAALALNIIPPRYVVSSKGDSYGRAELLAIQKGLDVLGTVLEAVKTVQKKPRH